MEPIERCRSLLGHERRGSGAVSRLAHALQCAANAERAGCSPHLVAACLLHDIGWALRAADPGVAQDERAESHATLGERFLAPWFPIEVTAPIGLHVEAKRYLCATETGYRDRLSGRSATTLALQGAPLRAAQARAFLRRPYAADAVRLRRFDEAAKHPGAATPPFEHFVPYLESALR